MKTKEALAQLARISNKQSGELVKSDMVIKALDFVERAYAQIHSHLCHLIYEPSPDWVTVGWGTMKYPWGNGNYPWGNKNYPWGGGNWWASYSWIEKYDRLRLQYDQTRQSYDATYYDRKIKAHVSKFHYYMAKIEIFILLRLNWVRLRLQHYK